jgi:hypothetical protein
MSRQLRCFTIAAGLVIVGCFLLESMASAELRAGAALRVITPEPLLPVSGGLGPTEPADKKMGELTARAMVLEADGQRVAIVSVDVLGFPAVLADRARKLVPRIPAENIVIGATHTHSAPDCYAFPDGQGGHTGDLAWMQLVCQRIAEAVNEALDQLQPAKLRIATGEVRQGIAYNYYAPDLYDRRASVIQVVDAEDHGIATLINFAVHPEVLGAEQGICSPDLVGPLCELVEQEAGGVALFMNGAQGGMITADNRALDQPSDARRGYWEDRRTWDECVRIGNALAEDALQMIGAASWQTNPQLVCRARDVTVPVESDALWDVVQHSPLKYPHGQNRTITSRINLICLGDARILTIPGEALPNVGFYLKRKMGAQHNLLFGLTNDAFGYILAKVDYQSFPRYDYVSRVSLGEMTGEILMQQALELIEAVPVK